VEKRLRFVARVHDSENMAGLCREFGSSRKSGYKAFNRYKDRGTDGLTDRSRRPYRHTRQQLMSSARKSPAVYPVSVCAYLQTNAFGSHSKGTGAKQRSICPDSAAY